MAPLCVKIRKLLPGSLLLASLDQFCEDISACFTYFCVIVKPSSSSEVPPLLSVIWNVGVFILICEIQSACLFKGLEVDACAVCLVEALQNIATKTRLLDTIYMQSSRIDSAVGRP